MAPVSYNGPHADELAQLFVTFCSFGSSKRVEEMDGAKFAKFCRDTKIVDKKFTTTDVDLTYAKAKAKGARKIDYVQFVKALELVAEKKAASLDDIVAKAVAAGGPSSSGTVRNSQKETN
ncbi:hypothetical protein KFL_002830130 [Klebsormidium nitens]|uniref:P25-alpha family protein n=1 Tax=Klebsormidium nitens TaxID=105231 RepID=A0A1Y1ICA1_KLENI|nr:hypothetical protein KFL_002830130 [Klebsormidium nitens]|eukprot:GAQ86336.1 hypothetical protein KFL_002830130 [Klebsormidium nitens]